MPACTWCAASQALGNPRLTTAFAVDTPTGASVHILVELPEGLERRPLRGVGVSKGVDHVILHALEGADGHSERYASLAVIARHVVDRLRASGHERAQHGGRPIHRRLYRAPRAPRLSQNVRRSNLHVVEVDLARLGADPAVHYADRNAGSRPVDRHEADDHASGVIRRIGRPRDHQDAVGDVGVRDEQLCVPFST